MLSSDGDIGGRIEYSKEVAKRIFSGQYESYEECVIIMNYIPIKLLEEAYHLIEPDEAFYWDSYIDDYKLAIVNVYETRVLEEAMNLA